MLGVLSFLTTSAPFLVPLYVHKFFLLNQQNFGSLSYWDYNAHICSTFPLFYLLTLPTSGLFSTWPLTHRKNSSDRSDHHCSSSDSSLPLPPPYFLPLSKEVPNNAVHYSTANSSLSSLHPPSLFLGQHNIQPWGKNKTKQNCCSQVWIP